MTQHVKCDYALMGVDFWLTLYPVTGWRRGVVVRPKKIPVLPVAGW